MVDLNSTVAPFLVPVGEFINSVKVFIGGVFGVYLLLLYFRWREYLFTKKILTSIQKDIRILAEKQGVTLDPIKESHLTKLTRHITHRLRKQNNQEKNPTSRAKKK